MASSERAGRPRPAVLMMIDGLGVAPDNDGNAVTRAQTPVFKMLTERYPVVTLRASSEEVGLSWGEMGNSEVGHLAVGAGRVYYQTLPRINKSVADGSFAQIPSFQRVADQVKKSKGKVHLVGLMSSGKVHSFNEHAYATLEAIKALGVKDVAVHAILDGRDTLYNSGVGFIEELEARLKKLGVGTLASLSGRFFAMDRDNRWDRVEKAYNAIVLGKAEHTAENAIAALQESYGKEVYDEEFPPTVITKRGVPVATVKEGDAIIFFNYRADRARELTQAFAVPNFDKFERTYLQGVHVVTLTEYEKSLPVDVAFPPEKLTNTLSEVVSKAGLVQLHVAETEKYAHVTFFFNGTREEPFPHEDRALIPSPHVASYDTVPEMSAYKITERVVKEVSTGNYDVIIMNFANPDMVGHTGNFDATVKAVEVIDECVGKIVNAVLAEDGVVCITADHGNAEEVKNLVTGDIDKEHSTNPVPFFIIGKQFEGKAGISGDVPDGDLSLLPPIGMLADVAPTFLALLNIDQPPEMTGSPLLP
ncbi:2,3-bisphosphoglycerate-independent phosphoglycerate mutase [Patescibacteria group bacterium]|nr:2,3-bisphosphoglycerate-independent phosphoglycerate mutase [Patescibacteria group bacterium]